MTGKDELKFQIGSNIRQKRLERGITQEQLADRIGHTPEHCAQVENGHKGLSIKALCQVANTLDVSVDYLVNGRTPQAEYGSIMHLLDQVPPEQLARLEQIIALFVACILDNDRQA